MFVMNSQDVKCEIWICNIVNQEVNYMLCVVGLDFIFDVLIIYNECEVFLDGKIL